MKKQLKFIIPLFIITVIVAYLLGFHAGKGGTIPDAPQSPEVIVEPVSSKIDEDGTYTSKEDVSLYLYTYQKLPSNYISKNEARKLGWVAEKENLWDVCKGCSIGGDVFQNREGLLPKKKGRTYYECDIDYKGDSRGAKRIVWSDDGLIFYTDDHYQSYTQLYGEEE